MRRKADLSVDVDRLSRPLLTLELQLFESATEKSGSFGKRHSDRLGLMNVQSNRLESSLVVKLEMPARVGGISLVVEDSSTWRTVRFKS